VTALGEQVNVAPAPDQRGPDDGLRLPVAFGGVDDVEPGVEPVEQQPLHGRRLHALEADLGAAEPEHTDREARASEQAALDHPVAIDVTPRDAGPRAPTRAAPALGPPA
jgi:hypothetical protein